MQLLLWKHAQRLGDGADAMICRVGSGGKASGAPGEKKIVKCIPFFGFFSWVGNDSGQEQLWCQTDISNVSLLRNKKGVCLRLESDNS